MYGSLAVCHGVDTGECAHGLCHKAHQPAPKAGVFALLRGIHTRGQHIRALECIAWLNGALGRHPAAMLAWERAAAEGSARAQLDLGLQRYQYGGPTSQDGAHAMFRAAVGKAGLAGLGLDGLGWLCDPRTGAASPRHDWLRRTTHTVV